MRKFVSNGAAIPNLPLHLPVSQRLILKNEHMELFLVVKIAYSTGGPWATSDTCRDTVWERFIKNLRRNYDATVVRFLHVLGMLLSVFLCLPTRECSRPNCRW